MAHARWYALRELTLGSLFDGIGGWLLAAEENNITPIWSSEIDDFPMAVSKYHFPEVKQLGDITKLQGATLPPVDIICAGSPCQDLSLAGNRKGLDGERSGLFRKAVEIIREMRRATNGQYPRWFVWENVPGAFSTNRGADFRVVLEEIAETKIPVPKSGKWAECGMVRSSKCEISWRVLDAQYWGVPQRRKRIFLIADFTRGGRTKVLFEPESLPRNTKTGENKNESPAKCAVQSTDEASWAFEPGITSRDGRGLTENKSPTLQANMGDNQTSVIYSIGHDERSARFKPNVCDPLMKCDYIRSPIVNEQVVAIEGNGARPSHKGDGYKESNTMYTLNSTEVHGVATFTTKSYTEFSSSDVFATLKAKGGTCAGGSETLVVEDGKR